MHRARRFFAPGAASEIWAEFGPQLQNPLLAGSMEVRLACGLHALAHVLARLTQNAPALISTGLMRAQKVQEC